MSVWRSLRGQHFSFQHAEAALVRSSIHHSDRTFLSSRVPVRRYLSSCTRHQRNLDRRKDIIRAHINSLVAIRRGFSTTPRPAHGDLTPPKPGEELYVTFIDKDGDRHEFEVAEGDNLLDIAQANDLEMEGACGGSCACSTCHVILEDPDVYDRLSEPDDDENDMLDLAFGLRETSRLGCQVKMSKDVDGMVVKLPAMTRNMQASDFDKKK